MRFYVGCWVDARQTIKPQSFQQFKENGSYKRWVKLKWKIISYLTKFEYQYQFYLVTTAAAVDIHSDFQLNPLFWTIWTIWRWFCSCHTMHIWNCPSLPFCSLCPSVLLRLTICPLIESMRITFANATSIKIESFCSTNQVHFSLSNFDR